MEDSLSGLLASWEGVQKSPRMEQSLVGYVALASSYLALGVAAFIYVFFVQQKKLGLLCCSGPHVRLKGFQSVHTFFYALLTMDVVHVVLTIIYLVFMSNAMIVEAALMLSLMSVSRHLMVLVHLLTVLMSICYLCNGSSEGGLRYMAPVTLVLSVAFAVAYCFFFSMLLFLGAFIIVVVVAVFLKNRFSRASPWKMPILFVATVSVSVACLPSFVFLCLFFYQQIYVTLSFYFYFESGTNIQLFLDALLCFCILKLPEEEEQTHPQPNHITVIHLPGGLPQPPAYDNCVFASHQETSNYSAGGSGNWRSGGRK